MFSIATLPFKPREITVRVDGLLSKCEPRHKRRELRAKTVRDLTLRALLVWRRADRGKYSDCLACLGRGKLPAEVN